MYIFIIYIRVDIYICIYVCTQMCVCVCVCTYIITCDKPGRRIQGWYRMDAGQQGSRGLPPFFFLLSHVCLSPSAPCLPFLPSSTCCLLVDTGCHCSSSCHIHIPHSRKRQGSLENSFTVGTLPHLQKRTKELGPLSKCFCNSPSRPHLSTGFVFNHFCLDLQCRNMSYCICKCCFGYIHSGFV